MSDTRKASLRRTGSGSASLPVLLGFVVVVGIGAAVYIARSESDTERALRVLLAVVAMGIVVVPWSIQRTVQAFVIRRGVRDICVDQDGPLLVTPLAFGRSGAELLGAVDAVDQLGLDRVAASLRQPILVVGDSGIAVWSRFSGRHRVYCSIPWVDVVSITESSVHSTAGNRDRIRWRVELLTERGSTVLELHTIGVTRRGGPAVPTRSDWVASVRARARPISSGDIPRSSRAWRVAYAELLLRRRMAAADFARLDESVAEQADELVAMVVLDRDGAPASFTSSLMGEVGAVDDAGRGFDALRTRIASLVGLAPGGAS